MNIFSFEVRRFPDVVFGPGVVARVGTETARFGKKAFVLTGRASARKSGLLDKVVADLRKSGLGVDVFEGIEPNPRVETIRIAAEQARHSRADVIVALGGGSVMDAAKGLGTALACPGDLWDYMYRGPNTKSAEAGRPIVTVPTTAATGSENNDCGVITNWARHEKMVLVNPFALPKAAILDPELMLGLPAQVTRDGAVDIIAHVLEMYIPMPELPLQDRFAEACILTVMESLAILEKNPRDVGARSQMLWANNCAQTFVCQGGREDEKAWSMHYIEHVLSGHYDVTHGAGLAAICEAWLARLASNVPARVSKLGQRVFKTSGAESAAKAMGNYLRSIGYRGMVSLGIPEDAIQMLADDVIRCYGFMNGKVACAEPLSCADISKILQASL